MGSTVQELEEITTSIRALAIARGRLPEDIAFFQGVKIVVGGTEEEARRKAAEIDEFLDPRALLAHMGGMMGVDLGGLPLDTPLGDIQSEGAIGFLEQLAKRYPDRRPTLRDILARQLDRIVGTPEQVADELERLQDAGVDGFNIINAFLPGSYDDFIEGALPELQRRGLAQTEYAPGTLREKLFGAGPHLNDRHPAAHYRGAFGHSSAEAENSPKVAAGS